MLNYLIKKFNKNFKFKIKNSTTIFKHGHLFISLVTLTFTLTLSGCLFRSPSVQPTFDEYKKASQYSLNQKPSAAKSAETASNANNSMSNNETATLEFSQATLKTSLGDITFKFYSESPQTVANFIKLTKSGFYSGVKFHRVIKDFMVQTGDPNSKDNDWSNDGQGGPGYQFDDEINNHKLVRGSVAMANAGPNTNGSQFFIVTAEATPWLDGKHTNFGEIIAGLDVLDKIAAAETNANDHPLQDITINSIELK